MADLIKELADWAEYWSKLQKRNETDLEKGWRCAAEEVLLMIKRAEPSQASYFPAGARRVTLEEMKQVYGAKVQDPDDICTSEQGHSYSQDQWRRCIFCGSQEQDTQRR